MVSIWVGIGPDDNAVIPQVLDIEVVANAAT